MHFQLHPLLRAFWILHWNLDLPSSQMQVPVYLQCSVVFKKALAPWKSWECYKFMRLWGACFALEPQFCVKTRYSNSQKSCGDSSWFVKERSALLEHAWCFFPSTGTAMQTLHCSEPYECSRICPMLMPPAVLVWQSVYIHLLFWSAV